jgi:hypothetical protein
MPVGKRKSMRLMGVSHAAADVELCLVLQYSDVPTVCTVRSVATVPLYLCYVVTFVICGHCSAHTGSTC